MNTPQELIGRKLQDRFVITDLLGEGAMGIVYRGIDAQGLGDVAVKVLQPALASQAENLARFYREASATRRVDHANTVRLLGRGEDSGLHFLVMELLDGRCLADILDAERRLGQARAARIVAQICGALAVAHERGIVHRDLKPENVMVSGSAGGPLGEHAKLLDFGVAKRISTPPRVPRLPVVEDSFSADDLTGCGSLVGTPEYMAPEQWRAEAVDARTDVYACGVMLYRMVTGRVPFSAAHPLELCQLHISDPPKPPSSHVPGLHPDLEAAILKAMSKAPEDRQQSAAELREDLMRALDRIAADESEITDAAPTSTLVSPELAARAAAELAAPDPAEDAPRDTIVAPPPARGIAVSPFAFWASFVAGIVSVLVTIGLIWRH